MAGFKDIDKKAREAYWLETTASRGSSSSSGSSRGWGRWYSTAWLNKFVVFGFPVSYWFEAQGSLAFFIVLIVWYAIKMNKLDQKYGVAEEA